MSALNLVPKGSLAYHAADLSRRSAAEAELAERDALFHSGLRQARNLVEAARAFRNADPGYWAELMNVAGEYRRFVVRRRKGAAS